MNHTTVPRAAISRAALTGLVLAALTSLASAQQIEIGILECEGGASSAAIIGSVSRFNCILREPGGAVIDRYSSTVRRFGLDIGHVNRSRLAWAVYAPTRRIAPGDLAGNYGGAAGSVSLGLGAGANVLVGGSANTIALQPLSVQGQVGVNLAVGVADMELRHTP